MKHKAATGCALRRGSRARGAGVAAGPVAGLLAALAIAAAAPAPAEEPEPLATYQENPGSLPPEHAWDLRVTIQPDGALNLSYCRGYETEGPACASGTARLSEEALDGIRAAAEASGLAARPAARLGDSEIPVGGGTRRGMLRLDGAAIDLPAFPRPEDEGRVGAVLDAIAAAVPGELKALVLEKAKAP